MATNPVNKDDPAYAGNEFFVQKKYNKAVVAYSSAIKKHPKIAKLYSNRSLTYLKLNRPYDALKDTEAGLKIEPNEEKLIFRKCTALLEMRQFPEASQFLDEGLKRMGRIPDKYEKEFKTLIDEMDRLKVEFVQGRYDIMAMIEENKNSSSSVKHADFYAWNKFEIREVEGKGRGLIAKEKIELGQLLIACEPFMFVPTSTPDATLMIDVRNKLSNRPDLAKQFYRLYAGSELGHLENWTEGESDWSNGSVSRELSTVTFCEIMKIWKGPPTAPEHLGLWLTPSFINHTCIDYNCARYLVGEFTFIRATKAIEIGEELVMSYGPPDGAFSRRQERCELKGFECHCRLCEIERRNSTSVKKRLEEIGQFLDCVLGRAPAARTTLPNDIQILKRFVKELRRNRPGLSFDYLLVSCREAWAVSVFYLNPKACIPMWKEMIEDLKSAGDFVQALLFTKVLHRAAMRTGCQHEQEECEHLARGIAMMFFGDERVADLRK